MSKCKVLTDCYGRYCDYHLRMDYKAVKDSILYFLQLLDYLLFDELAFEIVGDRTSFIFGCLAELLPILFPNWDVLPHGNLL